MTVYEQNIKLLKVYGKYFLILLVVAMLLSIFDNLSWVKPYIPGWFLKIEIYDLESIFEWNLTWFLN